VKRRRDLDVVASTVTRSTRPALVGVLGGLAVILAGCGPDPVDLSPDLEHVRAASSAPGLVAVVTDAERVVAQGATGRRVLGRPEAMAVEDVVHIGSITKPFTATLAAALVDAGALRWDTTVAAALPDVAATMRPEYADVTLADLLAHEGGVQPFVDDAAPEFLDLPALTGDPAAQRRRFASYALSLAPVHAPRTAYGYSNAGFAIATAIIEERAGATWERLVSERLFAPLGMKTAGVGWPNARDARGPWGHVERDGVLAPTAPDDPYRLPAWCAPAGDLSMSLPDLARFARAHLRGLDGREPLLRAETFRAMHTRRLRSGLGWGVTKLLGHEPVSTFSGSAGTFVAMIALVHDSDLGFVVAANAADASTEGMVKTVLKELVARFAGDRSER
jgi:CubicO group peptidase (beta-lactamase class C family)